MNDPNVIIISGRHEEEIIDYLPAAEDGLIKPGMLIEQVNDGTIGLSWQRNSSATGMPDMWTALPIEQTSEGISSTVPRGGVDVTFARKDNLPAHPLRVGTVFWGLAQSGQTITQGAKYQSNGDGTLKAVADATVARFRAQETLGAINALTRVRFMVIW